MSDPDFVHLHVHSEYSLLDGANRISDLVQACVRDGQRALALTDHGNMFGAVELYQKCRAAEISPIIGCEVYIAKHSRHDGHHRERNPYSHLTLLARNQEGYQNILKLASAAYIEGYKFRPRIDKELLREYSEGLICLSGCVGGEVAHLIQHEGMAAAEEAAREYMDIFGDNYYLEIQRHDIDVEEKINDGLLRLHKKLDVPLVATNDFHFLHADDHTAHDALVCIQTGKNSGNGDAPEAMHVTQYDICLLYTSPSPRDLSTSRMPSSA